MENNDQDIIRAFAKTCPDVTVAYGGDGEILNVWRKAFDEGKIIYPVRNYGRCEKHADPFASVDLGKASRQHVVVCESAAVANGRPFRLDALSEVQVKAADVTSALRMDIYVDEMKFCENVIADGVICSTPFGATGYFSSVARTLFTTGLGFAFIAPTLGVNNIVLPDNHKVEVRVLRPAEVVIAADKKMHKVSVGEGEFLRFYADPAKYVEFVGLDAFHCPVCRMRRHGTTIVNQYFK